MGTDPELSHPHSWLGSWLSTAPPGEYPSPHLIYCRKGLPQQTWAAQTPHGPKEGLLSGPVWGKLLGIKLMECSVGESVSAHLRPRVTLHQPVQAAYTNSVIDVSTCFITSVQHTQKTLDPRLTWASRVGSISCMSSHSVAESSVSLGTHREGKLVPGFLWALPCTFPLC